jgi:hypothetical protein
MSDDRDRLLDSLTVERFGPLTRLLAEKAHDEYAERRRLLTQGLPPGGRADEDDEGE